MRTRTAEEKLGSNGVLTDEISKPIPVGESWHHIFFIYGKAAGTNVKFRGSIQTEELSEGQNQVDGVDFQEATSETNRWQYVRIYDIKTGGYYSGEDGIDMGDGDAYLVELNINAIETVAVEVTGEANVTFRGYSTGE